MHGEDDGDVPALLWRKAWRSWRRAGKRLPKMSGRRRAPRTSLANSAATKRIGGEGEFDPLLLARTQTSLSEQLLLHLGATSRTPQEMLVAEYLVDSLDERGWLQIDVDEACTVLRVPCRMITQGIERLQSCDPPGVGARNLRECLLLQMRHLSEEGDETSCDPIALTLHHAPLGRFNSEPQLLRSPESWGSRPKRHRRPPRNLSSKRLKPNPAAGFRMPWDHQPSDQSRGHPARCHHQAQRHGLHRGSAGLRQ